MGKTTLTTEQLNFLELVQKEPQITKRFYWTGGTVLAEFYLKHRLSEDIDLFNETEEVDQALIDPFLRIEKGSKYKNLEIDSIYDIAVNKIHTMFMRTRSRDFVDIYFIMKSIDYKLDQLIKDAKIKFDWHIDQVTLASQFMKVKELKDLPTMLVPFNRKAMEEFFLQLAKSLQGEIFK